VDWHAFVELGDANDLGFGAGDGVLADVGSG
jgi:hypothetical protein